jgi:hypothetical protein
VKRHFITTLMGFLLAALSLGPALAQNTCPQIVQQALGSLDQWCGGTGRNQLCYGNVSIEAQPQPGVTDWRFEQVGDTVSIADLATLTLSQLQADEDKWGVALMRVQANLPDSLPGQNVTFLMFGDVEIINQVTPGAENDLRPMQAFQLRTGVNDAACAEAPQSGVLVQTPEGGRKVNFTINGVEMAIGSTVFFQSDLETSLAINTLEGEVGINAAGQKVQVPAGSRVSVPIRRGGTGFEPRALLIPLETEAVEGETLLNLPLDLLDYSIELPPVGDES